jgi:hypothetical protein
MPNVKLSPRTLLAWALEHVEDIESVVIVPVFKGEGEEVGAYWSSMRTSHLTMASAKLGLEVAEELAELSEGDR